MMKPEFTWLILLFFLGSNFCRANVRLPAIISSNMVLQQKSHTKLWGWAEPNEKIVITTSWDNRSDSTKADGNAHWQLNLRTPSAGGPHTITIKGYNTITLQNVLIGEVWICSGQSNMEMNYYWGLPQMRDDIPVAANANIRFYQVPKNTAGTPQQLTEGLWSVCDSTTVKSFSAVAYYFGKKLNADLNVPIGLVHASWGGTPAEAWTPSELITTNETLNNAAQKLAPSTGWPIAPGAAYNAMIAPLHKFSIAGVIWYQGESNTGTAATYQSLFSSMINSWREKWFQAFPFYFVQLAPFNYGNNSIGALLREAQLKTLSVPKTGMVVTTDLTDDTADIHPRNKRDVGLRLAALALAETYGLASEDYKSPLLKAMEISKDKIRLSFSSAKNGLMKKGKEVSGFLIAGEDQKFYPAKATIIGETITVWSRDVARPAVVRYAFSNTAVGNVFNKNGLPVSPFRTDDWQIK